MGNQSDKKTGRPSLPQVSFPPCCQTQLRAIDETIETAKWLAAFTGTAPFILLFADLPKKGGPVKDQATGAVYPVS